MTEAAAAVTLLRLGRRPPSQYAELIEAHGSAGEALERELAEDADGQTRINIGQDIDDRIAAAERDLKTWANDGINVRTILDPDYPANLRRVHDRPPLLFLSGAIDQSRDQAAVAVIGTRQPTQQGIERTRQLADYLAAQDITVISGLAAGIDTVAHATALEQNGRTVAVIGTGLHHAYPPDNAPLQAQIAQTGAVVSQFWPDAGPTRQSFPQRNALMSGLAQATVIVEASVHSGTRVQARRSLAQARPVFLHQSLTQLDWARELSARPATYLYASPDQITDQLARLTDPGSLVA